MILLHYICKGFWEVFSQITQLVPQLGMYAKQWPPPYVCTEAGGSQILGGARPSEKHTPARVSPSFMRTNKDAAFSPGGGAAPCWCSIPSFCSQSPWWMLLGLCE